MRGDRVDDVPPRPRDDDLLEYREGVEVPEGLEALPAGQLDGRVHLLAEGRPAEEAEDLPPVRGGVANLERAEERPAGRAQRHGPHSVERHRRLHVGLRAACAGGIAERGEAGAEGAEEGRRADHGGILARSGRAPAAASVPDPRP